MATRTLWTRLFLTIFLLYGAFLLVLQVSLRETLQPPSAALLDFSLNKDAGPSLERPRKLRRSLPKSISESKHNTRIADGSRDPMGEYNATVLVGHLHANSILMRRLKETKQYLAAKVKEVSMVPTFRKPSPERPLKETVDFLKLNDDFYVYSAFWDTRSRVSSNIRILALCPTFESESQWTAFCHLESTPETIPQNQHQGSPRTIKARDSLPSQVEAQKYPMCENHGKKYGGWILTCPVRSDFNASSISISLAVENYDGTRATTKLNLPIKRIRGRERHIQLETPARQLQKESEKARSGTSSRGDVRQRSLNNTVTKFSLGKNATKSYKEQKHEYNADQRSGPQYLKNNSAIGVCVPPLYGDIDLTRIVNFVEMARILGARQVFLYINAISRDVRQLLEEYVQLDSTFLQLVEWNIPVIETEFNPTLPSDSTSLPASEVIWNRGQLPAIQHCLYSNMDAFDWLLFMDIDEMLFPRKAFTWDELFGQATAPSALKPTENVNNPRNLSPKVAGFVFESAVFQTDPQSQALYTIDYFQKLSRPIQTDKGRTKLAVRPEMVFEMGIHHLSKAFVEGSLTVQVPPEIALVHHYRDGESLEQTVYYFQEETTLFYDNSSLKYETLLTETSQSVMNALGRIMMARNKTV